MGYKVTPQGPIPSLQLFTAQPLITFSYITFMFIYLCCMFHKYGNFHMHSTEDIWGNKIYMSHLTQTQYRCNSKSKAHVRQGFCVKPEIIVKNE